ncbi:MAG: polysaccharide deacetylase family protein [Anaerolineae bacterium]
MRGPESASTAQPTETRAVVLEEKATTPPADPATDTPLPVASATVAPLPTLIPTGTPFFSPPLPGQAARIPILMYHHLAPLGPNPSQTSRDWTVSPDSFTAQLDYLVAQGYHTITFVQLVAFFQGQPLPTHPIILTFDDGWIDDYTVAFPALHARRMIGTFFVPTQYADAGGKTLINWAQVQEMDAAGMEFGGHTINHADLKKVSSEEATRQLQNSKYKMEQKLGHSTIAFAYPFGSYNAETLALVRQSGYRAAVGLCCGYQLRADLLLTLPRIRVSYDDTLQDFIKRLPPADPAKLGWRWVQPGI